ncbi:MAG: alpha/beta fold hydrolase [Firmicutes bacterium]|nr:alpha/beta fold hydrolase [Bacillota bacterium]
MRLKPLIVALLTLFALAPLLVNVSEANEKKDFDLGAEGAAEFLNAQGLPPPGANDPECTLEEGKNPIILVPGTFERSSYNFLALSPELADRDYCVYAMNYGQTLLGPSTGPIEESAQELQAFINNVLELTGSDQVDIIGHSQGGMMPRYYMKFMEGDENVDDLIAFAPSNHGTDGLLGFRRLTGLVSLITDIEAIQQQLAGSDFLEELNEGEETPGDVSYTNITTKRDGIVTPYTRGFLDGPEDQVSNITIQDHLGGVGPGHIGIVYHKPSYLFVLDALENEGPADPRRAVTSTQDDLTILEEEAPVTISEEDIAEINQEIVDDEEKDAVQLAYDRLSTEEQEQVLKDYIENGQHEIAQYLDPELFDEMEN